MNFSLSQTIVRKVQILLACTSCRQKFEQYQQQQLGEATSDITGEFCRGSAPSAFPYPGDTFPNMEILSAEYSEYILQQKNSNSLNSMTN